MSQAAVLTAVVGAGVAFTSVDKAVALSVDGKTSHVHVFGSTVADVLSKQHITVGAHDIVAPGLSSGVHDGETVVVRYGRLLSVTVDGVARQYWTTATTVEAALAEIGVRDAGATLSVSRSQPLGRAGLTMSVSTPKTVTIKADKKTISETTTGLTVLDALTQAGLTLGKDDRVTPGVGTSITRSGLTVTVARVTHKSVTDTVAVHYATTHKNTSSLYKGQSKTVTHGKDGSKAITYADLYIDGKRTEHKVTATKVTRQAVTAVIEVGTKSRPVVHVAARPASPSRSSRSSSRPSSGGHSAHADGLNWAALARCESGGNPRAVNSAGYYGLYQFSLSTWRSVGGSGNPINASSGEQTYRAQILYGRTGASSWPVCGRQL